jgi:CheY-like chemotaxis protein
VLELYTQSIRSSFHFGYNNVNITRTFERNGRSVLLLSSDDESQFRPIILCVDDEPRLLETRALILKSQGYATAVASNGSMALSIFERINPDLVILDYSMPEMNGQEAALEMRKSEPKNPVDAVICVSGSSSIRNILF